MTIQAMAQQVQWACSSDEELYDCIAAAQFYELGREDEQDDGEVARLYRRACYAGSVRHCANFGVQRFESPPSSPPQRALSQERKECYESGGDWPCPRLLRRLAGSVEVVHAGRTATEIVHGLEAACQLGNAQACAYVGFAFWQGHGVSQSDTEAVAYLRRACEGQDAYGCRFLAFLAETGQGMTQDQAEAAQLYQRVCRFNRSNAFGCSTPWGRDLSDQGWQHHAALALRLEPENRPSVNELAQRLGESCKGGDGFGCRYLAARYGPRNGSLGTVRDQARLYRQSCDLGNLVGCLSLGHLLMGRGERSVIKDRNEAARLFEKACEGGIESACQALDPDGFLHFSGWIERSWVSVADFLTRLGS